MVCGWISLPLNRTALALVGIRSLVNRRRTAGPEWSESRLPSAANNLCPALSDTDFGIAQIRASRFGG